MANYEFEDSYDCNLLYSIDPPNGSLGVSPNFVLRLQAYDYVRIPYKYTNSSGTNYNYVSLLHGIQPISNHSSTKDSTVVNGFYIGVRREDEANWTIINKFRYRVNYYYYNGAGIPDRNDSTYTNSNIIYFFYLGIQSMNEWSMMYYNKPLNTDLGYISSYSKHYYTPGFVPGYKYFIKIPALGYRIDEKKAESMFGSSVYEWTEDYYKDKGNPELIIGVTISDMGCTGGTGSTGDTTSYYGSYGVAADGNNTPPSDISYSSCDPDSGSTLTLSQVSSLNDIVLDFERDIQCFETSIPVQIKRIYANRNYNESILNIDSTYVINNTHLIFSGLTNYFTDDEFNHIELTFDLSKISAADGGKLNDVNKLVTLTYNIDIPNTSDGTTVDTPRPIIATKLTFDVLSSPYVKIVGNKLTIDLTSNPLAANTKYTLKVPSGAILSPEKDTVEVNDISFTTGKS